MFNIILKEKYNMKKAIGLLMVVCLLSVSCQSTNKMTAEEALVALNRLIVAGGDLEAPDSKGRTLLAVAASEGHVDIVNTLISAGANVNAMTGDGTTVLILAARNGQTEVIDLLISAGANINAKADPGMTALAIAVYNGHIGVVEKLITAGADLDVKMNTLSLLDIATFQGHTDIVTLLTSLVAPPLEEASVTE